MKNKRLRAIIVDANKQGEKKYQFSDKELEQLLDEKPARKATFEEFVFGDNSDVTFKIKMSYLICKLIEHDDTYEGANDTFHALFKEETRLSRYLAFMCIMHIICYKNSLFKFL